VRARQCRHCAAGKTAPTDIADHEHVIDFVGRPPAAGGFRRYGVLELPHISEIALWVA
jgi:hypothetical protein